MAGFAGFLLRPLPCVMSNCEGMNVIMKKQRGAAIIVVMLILVVITVLGIAAVRMGLTSLSVATNSQISALLFQAADTGLVTFEQKVGENPQAAALPTGIVGPSLNEPGIEKPYCITASNRLKPGLCSTSDYTSARGAVINQIAIEVPAAADGTPMRAVVLGTDLDRAGISNYVVNVHSTSLVPAFGAAGDGEIEDCLQLPNNDNDDVSVSTVTDCLTDEGAVFKTLVQEYSYGYN